MAEEVGARQRLDGQARRYGGGDDLEQVGGIPRQGAGVDLTLLAAPVDHGETGVEGGAAPRIGAAVDGGGERDVGRRVEGREGVGPGGIAGNAMRRGDGHQPPAGRQHGEGGADVTQVRVVADGVHAGARRERRVHEHDGGTQLGKAVPDGLGVVAGDRRAGEQPGQQPCASGSDLVQVKRGCAVLTEGALGHHGQHAGACRRFEDDIVGPDGGRLERGVGERQRRRELLQTELLLRAPGLGGLQCRKGHEHAEHGGGAAGAGAGLAPHGAAVALEEEHHGRLGRLVGVLPEPCALGVARAEGAGHGLAQ